MTTDTTSTDGDLTLGTFEKNLFATTDVLGESREASRHDAAVCRDCGRGDEVETEKEREGTVTVKRHRCNRCGTYGATVVEARHGDEPARVRTGGDVETVDLALSVNADYRGTF